MAIDYKKMKRHILEREVEQAVLRLLDLMEGASAFRFSMSSNPEVTIMVGTEKDIKNLIERGSNI